MQRKNLKAYMALALLAAGVWALFAHVLKVPEQEFALQEARAYPVQGKSPSFLDAKAAGLSDQDSEKYALFHSRTTEQFMVNANELGEPRYPHCVYPPLPPQVWVAKGKPVPPEVVFLSEDEQEGREAARLDKVLDQQAKYNGPVGNTP